jgi:hypothetical protein
MVIQTKQTNLVINLNEVIDFHDTEIDDNEQRSKTNTIEINN